MTSLTYDELADLNPVFVEAEDPSEGLALGEYIFRIDSHRAERSKAHKRMVVTELAVVAGAKAGETTTLYNTLESTQEVGRYKALLKNMGVNSDEAGFDLARFLTGGNAILIGKFVKGSRTESSKVGDNGKKSRFTNILGVATQQEVIDANNGGAVASGAPAPGGSEAAWPSI